MIFLDSGDISEIKKFNALGIIRGCTTNPTIMLRDGVRDLEKAIRDISTEIYPYELSVEVTSNDKEEMIDQATYFDSLCPNVNVKIPIHGPLGELHYLEVIEELSKSGISINATACMSAQQLLLAALAGADYVSLFGGRVDDMGHNCISEIKKMRKLIDRFNLETRIIIGSVRSVNNIITWLSVGADIVTCPPNILEKMIIHPYTSLTVQQFLRDSKKGV